MSRVEKILIALINGTSYDGPLLSRVEEILYSFLVDSTYDKPGESRVEDLLLALKNSSLYSDSVISRIEEILYCKLGNVEYTGPIGSRVEALLVQWELTKIIVITGVPPFTFNAKGTPLLDYTIYGNTIQSGTPTPDSPIEPEFVGELVTEGEYAGQYKIPISSGGQTKNIYLGQVQTTRRIKKYVITGEEGWYDFYSSWRTGIFQSLPPQVIDDRNGISNVVQFGRTSGNSWNIPYVYGDHFDVVFRTIYSGDRSIDSLEKWINYCKERYANGTPVTIWYVIEPPTTGIVNEPLAKIGDYADSVDFSQAGVEIPVTAGENTLSVGTTVQPSNMSIEVEEGHVPKKPVYITSDDKLYITSNDEVYILRR